MLAAKLVHELLPERGARLARAARRECAARRTWAGGEVPSCRAARTRIRVGSRVRSGCSAPAGRSRVLTGEQSRLDESLESVARIFEAIPSIESACSSRKYRRSPMTMSRRTIRLQRSPNTSMAALIGHPDRSSLASPVLLAICHRLVLPSRQAVANYKRKGPPC